MKIRKGDSIIVIAGKDRGKTGVVARAFPKKDMVVIAGVHTVKRHQKPRRQGQAGQVIEKVMPIHVSNVALKDPNTGKPTRVGYTVTGAKKSRVAKKSATAIV